MTKKRPLLLHEELMLLALHHDKGTVSTDSHSQATCDR